MVILLIALLGATTLFGQPATPSDDASKPKASFEVASIRPANLGAQQVTAGAHIDDAQVRFVMLSVKDYICMAYKVKQYQVTGPDALNQRYDISATVPDKAKRELIPEMMQSLLMERFGMKFHRASKEFPVYGLTVAKGGLKLTPLTEAVEDMDKSAAPVNVAAMGSRAGTVVRFGNGATFTFGGNKIEGKKLTLANLAETLARFTDRPVIDATETPGHFDFTLEFTSEDFQAMMIRSAINAGITLPPQALQYAERASGDSLSNALGKLGLKLESRKAPLDLIVVDEIRKTPTEN